MKKILKWLVGSCFILVATFTLVEAHRSVDFSSYEWSLINEEARWAPRAGLQVVNLRNRFYLMGGRTPRPPSFPPIPGNSEIWGDVWKSSNKGRTWKKILDTNDETHWPARAYFQAVTKGKYMYVLGGQNFKLEPNNCPPFVPDCPPFVSTSDFFNDVWRSRDGIHWKQMTDAAQWSGRAGLSSVVYRGEIYIMGGSFNDDPAVIGGPPTRVYYNDVWKSRNGRDWIQMTDNAPWSPRAGSIVVVKNDYMYLLGGEDGFTCLPDTTRCPPYFNDVWRSSDGANWELVTESAEWAPRPGHQVVVMKNHFVLFGGFGLSNIPEDPFKASNPMDVWISRDGAKWKQVSDSPWNAVTPEEIKYDFDALVVKKGRGRHRPSIYTFGGDRETFDFNDINNYLNVDNDVWRFSPPRWFSPHHWHKHYKLKDD